MKRFTQKELQQIGSLRTINNRKDWVQTFALNTFRYTPKCLFRMFAGCGKGTLIIKLIKLMNTNKPSYTICLIVPTQKLYEDALKDVAENDLQNVSVYIVNTYAARIVKHSWKPEFDLLIIDEADVVSNKEALLFPECMPKTKFKFFLGLSATFTREQIQFFQDFGIPLTLDFPIRDGYLAKMVPEYDIYNIPIKLTQQEKYQYYEAQEKFADSMAIFKLWKDRNTASWIIKCLAGEKIKEHDKETNTYTTIEIPRDEFLEDAGEVLQMPTRQVMVHAMEWQRAMNTRKSIIKNSKNTYNQVLNLASELDDKTIIFAPSIDMAETLFSSLPNSITSHSRLTKKVRTKRLKEFEEGKYQKLIVIESLNRGYNLESIKYMIQWGFTSKPGTFDQRLGRGTRFDQEDEYKHSFMYTFYIQDYVMSDGTIVKSQQQVWLNNALRKNDFVEWLDFDEEIPR